MFKPDSPIATFLTHMFDFVMVNLLFVLTSLPIVTIGAAWSSMYHVISNLVDDSSTSLGVFFETFRSKFKVTTAVWVPSAALFFLLLTESLYISNTYGTDQALPGGGTIQIILILLSLLAFAVLSYAFPLLGVNDLPLKQTLSISFYLAASNLPATIVMTVLNAAPVLAFFFLPDLAAVWLPIWLLFAFSAVTWIDSVLIKRILKKYNSAD